MLILVLGGARSGKSQVAEDFALRLPQPVTYMATLTHDGTDADLEARIDAHRRRRPGTWHTIDANSDIAEQLLAIEGTVLLDSLGPWVAGHGSDAEATDSLVAAVAKRRGDTVVVSDEVGMSVHPTTEAGLVFRDALGAVNTAVAQVADRTFLIVAGRVVTTAAANFDTMLAGGR